MRIDEFCIRFGDNARNANEVMRQWKLEELNLLVQTLQDQHDQIIGGAVVVGDALHGGTLLDQIPRELKDAFANLMHEKADSYAKMRTILLQAIQTSDGTFRPFDDDHVRGLISKLKGQIGENLFKQHIGSAAELATSGSQEAWDVAVKQTDGAYEYVQVKLYANPHDVVRQMLKVQEKVDHGWISGCAGDTVHQIDFAVPADIAERVNDLKDCHSELDSIRVLTIPINAHRAADFVREGMSNVGPDQLGHFFDELLGGAIAAGSLHAIVNGFLWYKGSKEFSQAFADAAASSAISTTGIAMGLVAETLCHSVMLSSAIGIGSRLFLGRLARSRWNFAEFMAKSIAETEARTATLANIFPPMPAMA